jgi:hypothetical protein
MKIQTDDCNCGLYSVLVNLIFVLKFYSEKNYDVDNIEDMKQLAKDIIDTIGKNAEGLKTEIFDIKRYLTGVMN